MTASRDVPPWHPEATQADRDAAWHAELDRWRDELDPPRVWDLPTGRWLWALCAVSLGGWTGTVLLILWWMRGGGHW